MGGDGAGEGRWRGARREVHGWGRGWGGKVEGSETGGAWVGTRLGREDGGERDGRCMGGDGAWVGSWVGLGLGREDGGERDGRRMGRWSGARREAHEWRRGEDGGREVRCHVCGPVWGITKARREVHGWGRAGEGRWRGARREANVEGADAAPCFLERLSEAMLQSFYDRFGGLSKLTKGWTGVYMADRGGRMRTRTAMLEISWLPRSLEGADASFWPANVCLSIFPGLCASFCFWVRGLTLFPYRMHQFFGWCWKWLQSFCCFSFSHILVQLFSWKQHKHTSSEHAHRGV